MLPAARRVPSCAAPIQLAVRRGCGASLADRAPGRASESRLPRRIAVSCRPKEGRPEEGGEAEEEWEGLAEEDDWVVQGGSKDSLSSNTDLGQAVRSAVEELEVLGNLEREVLGEAQALLEKLGYKGSIGVEKTKQEDTK